MRQNQKKKLSPDSLPLFQALDLVHSTKEQLQTGLPDTPFRLAFEDGTIVTTKARTIWSWHLWKIHRTFQLTPILVRHHIGKAVITPDTHIGILTSIKRDYHTVYNHDGSSKDIDRVNKLIHECYNEMYNAMIVDLEEYVSGANILDILEMLKEPTIVKANKMLFAEPNITSQFIEERYAEIAEVFHKSEALKRNSVAVSYRCKLVKQPQLLQCVTARGFMSDVDGANFREPMLHGYAQGMRKLSAYAADSRMASLSAFSQHAIMSRFQYVNRSMQILNSDMKNIHRVDCGTTNYTIVTVDTMPKLNEFVGKYIMNKYGAWEVIDHTDESLLNKPLKLRTLQDCIHPDRHGVCMRCLGDLYTGYVEGDGLGQATTQHVKQSESQGVLSVKHFTANAFDFVTDISKLTAKYFIQPSTDKANLYVSETFKSRGGQIIFNPKEIENINNLTENDSLSELTISRYAKLTKIQCRTATDNVEVIEMISVENGTNHSILTSYSLNYILQYGWTINSNGHYVVDLANWDTTKPFFCFPRKKIDLVAAGKEFSNFMKGNKKKEVGETKSVVDYDNLGQAIRAFQDISIPYSAIKVSHIEVMLYGLLAADPDNQDYRLPNPLNRKSAKFVPFYDKVTYGNIATAMAYENQGGIIESPASYILDNRSPSDYEYYLLGQEKIKRREYA